MSNGRAHQEFLQQLDEHLPTDDTDGEECNIMIHEIPVTLDDLD
jgi:hypothetical protein